MKNDVIFRAYITNLGLYNEGCLTGEWVNFPIQNDGLNLQKSIQQILRRIGIDVKEYEEYFITDYDSNIAGLTECLGEYENIFSLNLLANKILGMDCSTEQLESMIAYGESTNSVSELITLICNTDSFYFMPEVNNDYDLGYEYAENSGMFTEAFEQMGTLRNYIDYESYGRDIRLTESGIYTKNGYISLTDDITEMYE